jgi:hypothetical protein
MLFSPGNKGKNAAHGSERHEGGPRDGPQMAWLSRVDGSLVVAIREHLNANEQLTIEPVTFRSWNHSAQNQFRLRRFEPRCSPATAQAFFKR